MNEGTKALEKIGNIILDKTQDENYGEICFRVKHLFYNSYNIIEKEIKALNIISKNFKLVDNCLYAKNEYANDGWLLVKRIEDEEELGAWKEVFKNA